MTEHSLGKLLLIGCMVLVWAVMIAINALSTQKAGRDIGLLAYYHKKNLSFLTLQSHEICITAIGVL